jgi:hypothetical protein
VSAHQPSVSATERQSRQADLRIGSERHGETESLRRTIHITEPEPAADPRRPGDRVDLDVAEARDIQNDTFTDREASHAVPAAAHTQASAAFASERHRRPHVLDVPSEHDGGRVSVDATVPHPTRGVILAISREDDVGATKTRPQSLRVEDGHVVAAESSGAGNGPVSL